MEKQGGLGKLKYLFSEQGKALFRKYDNEKVNSCFYGCSISVRIIDSRCVGYGV